MAAIIDCVAYLLEEYPFKDELSNARVTKMLYLADWYAAISDIDPVTEIRWYFDNNGPFVWDVKEAVMRSSIASVHETINVYGGKKNLFVLDDEDYEPILDDNEAKCLDHVIKETKSLYWDQFIKLVYSTHPISSSKKYSFLDLESKAREYKRIKS